MNRFYRTALVFFPVFAAVAVSAQPGGVGGSRVWYKANAGMTLTSVTNPNEVQTWGDQSGGARDVTQGTVTKRPLLLSNALNFNPTVQFTPANSHELTRAGGIIPAAAQSNLNVFIVSKSSSVSASSIFYENQVGASGRINAHIPWSDGVLYWDAGAFTGSQRLSTVWNGSLTVGQLWTLMASTASTPSGQRQDIYRNALLLASDNDMATYTGNGSTFSLGSTGGGNYLDGEIAEIILYTSNLTAAQMLQVNSYLALKYGITMDQSVARNYVASDGTTIIWNGTTNASYKNDIAGIGRDNTSALDQRKSTSSNSPSDVITVANTSISAPTIFATNLNFLSWGHNGQLAVADPAAATFTHNGPATSIQASLKRIWSTNLTGAPAGNAIVQFNMDAISGPTGLGTNANTQLRLLVDGNAVFSDGSAGESTISPTVGFAASGGLVEFAVPYASLSGQKFFTLGSADKTTCPLYTAPPGGTSATLKLWLRADASLTGSPVSSWSDQSGYGFVASQATSANRPANMTNRVNFNPAVQFDGALTQLLIPGGISGTASYTNFNVFAVARTNTVSNSSLFYETQSGGNRTNAHLPWGDAVAYWDAGSAGSPQRLSVAWGGATAKNYVWTFMASTGATPSGQRQDIYRDGRSLASDNDMASFTGNNSTMFIGSNGTGNIYNGEIAELLMYTSSMTAVQMQNINSYLAVKYGITLDQTAAQNYTASDWNGATGTTIWDAAVGGTYKNDIAAIGRDDNSSTNQKQSGSSNSGNVLFIANTAFATDNPGNTNTLSADKSFLSWAHNGAALASAGVADFAGPTIKARIARVWKAQETGTVNTVRVRFNLSTVPGVAGVAGANDLANVRLLVDADGVFAAGATIVAPATFDNTTDIVEFDQNFIAGTGFYFTLGTTDLATAPLPVQLLSFEAKATDNDVEVNWVTESELNNDYFVVESSQDGEAWGAVRQVKGKGTTAIKSKYSIVDERPYTGVSYYRLRQVDFDGSSELSKVVMVKFESNSILMYPNPVQGQELTFELSGKSISTGIRIVNMSGVEMLRTPLDAATGQKQKFSVNVEGYAPGVYIVTLYTTESLQHTKLIVR
jgi:hypothetical protein